MTHHHMLARQPIYNRKNELYGFELLYRNSKNNQAVIQSQVNATAELITNLCTCALEENLNINKPLFINFSEEFITSDHFFPGPAYNVVLEILETVPATKAVLAAIKKLRAKGFRFALDDYEFTPDSDAFLPLISILKVDVMALPLSVIAEKITALKNSKLILLAEKVEDEACYRQCIEMGFHLFQGYYLERPTIIKGTKVSSSKQVALRLLSSLSRSDISVDEVTHLLSCDPRLIYKLLKIVNCPLYPFKREVENIREAIVMLGLETIKQWALILIATSESQQPKELFRTLFVRAKALEIYGSGLPGGKGADYFTLGLFSGIDAVLNLDLETVLEDINLAAPIRDELLEVTSEVTSEIGILKTIKAFERGDKDVMATLPDEMLTAIAESYQQSIKWADELMRLLV